MKRTTMLRALGALALAIALTPLSLEATPIGPDGDEARADGTETQVRVVNNHDARVAVYRVDGDSRELLGTVKRTHFESFEIPAGTMRLEVIALSGPAGLGHREEAGIGTRPIEITPGQAIQLWLEPDLTASTATLMAG